MSRPTKRVVDLVRVRAAGRCEICRSGKQFQVHHRRPRGMGGSTLFDTNLPSNLLYLCGDCHLRMVEVERSEAIRNGWLVPQFLPPALAPVRLGAGTWVYLDDDGGVSHALAGVQDRQGLGDSG